MLSSMLKTPTARSINRQMIRRSFSETNDFEHGVLLHKFFKNFKFRDDSVMPREQKSFMITRDTNRQFDQRKRFAIKGPDAFLLPDGFTADTTISGWQTTKAYVRGRLKSAFIRGLGLHEEKDEFLKSCQAVFFEVLRSIIEKDFSSLADFTLGGHKTLQFHQNAANKLSDLQRESLKINETDFLNKSGYILSFPFFKNELGSFIHKIDFVNLDATGNDYFTEDKKPKIFLRYRVVFGAIYEFEKLKRELRTRNDMYERAFAVPKSYKFKSPRFTFVELEICQQVVAPTSLPTKLDSNRFLYDFHVFSF